MASVPLNRRQLDAAYLGDVSQPCKPTSHSLLVLRKRPSSARPSCVRRQVSFSPQGPGVRPSSTLPGGRPSSPGSVAWLSQSPHAGRWHSSRPSDVSWGGLSAPAGVSSSGEPPQIAGVGE